MTSQRIRVGLIGVNIDPAKSWSTRAHVPALKHLPDFELRAVCTTRQETAAAAAAHFGVPLAFGDAAQMAAHPEVDAVVVSVRTPAHRAMVQAALNARKHVYCEWPLGASTAEARQILEETRRAGVVNMIGLQGRHNETLCHVRELIAQGYIGRMVSVTVKVTQEIFGPLETQGNAYTADIRNGAGLLNIGAGQALEAVCWAVGELRGLSAVVSNQHPVATLVDGSGTIQKTSADQVLISGVLENGAVISVHVRGGASPATAYGRVEINGTEGDIVLTSEGGANIHRIPMLVQGAKRGEKTLTTLPLPEKFSHQLPGVPEGPARYLAYNYQAFGAAIRGGPPVALDFAYAVRWQELIDAIQRASDTGQRQTFAAG